MRRPIVDPRFGPLLRELREKRDLTLRALAKKTLTSKTQIHNYETGQATPSVKTVELLDRVLDAGGQLTALVRLDQADRRGPELSRREPRVPASDDGWGDELDAIELARRVDASDVSAETLVRIERAVDDLAIAYATTPPEQLLPRIRRHLGYIARLLDVRATLDQRRRLMVAGGWLSLLGATVHIDLRQTRAAAARLTTADQLAGHAGHDEIRAWCLETQAWDVLIAGDFRRAVELSQQAQAIAPRGSSAHIQAVAQEGRGWARMRKAAETRAALNRVGNLTANLRIPEQPEHHYRYDPAKAVSYTATTLAWVGDPAAEEYARTAIAELEAAHDGARRPRRIASARLDLGLALLAAKKPDEAGAEALAAITSGRVVPSNWWRVAEIVLGVERAGIGETAELRDAFEEYRPKPAANG